MYFSKKKIFFSVFTTTIWGKKAENCSYNFPINHIEKLQTSSNTYIQCIYILYSSNFYVTCIYVRHIFV